MTRKKRVTRVVYGIYVLIVAAFTVSNIEQVATALFGPNGGAAKAEPPPQVGEACARAIGAQYQAIEGALAAASQERTGEAARSRYATARSERGASDLEQACSGDPHGADALAALARFDRAAGSRAVRTAGDLSPVRLSAQSFIRHPQ